MNIFETIGMAWVIFTSAIGSIAIFYVSYVGLRATLNAADKNGTAKVPVEVKELFKIAR